MRYFLIAGEPSGDLHAAGLMGAIRDIDPAAEFRFIGGDSMTRIGGKPIIHIRDLGFMGFTHLLMHFGKIWKTFRVCHREIAAFRPDVVIPVDFGGFNLRLIRWASARGYRIVYYITPKTWAWAPWRSKKLAKHTRKVLCILPFEPEFLSGYGVSALYVGNPVADYTREICERHSSQEPVIALLPGSRKQEIQRILPLMASVASGFPGYEVVVAACDPFTDDFYTKLAGNSRIRIERNRTLELLRISEAALVTSGTATLEAAMLGTPQVVCYRTEHISYLIARILIRVKYISLVNLILNKPVVKELIQRDFNKIKLTAELHRILNEPAARSQMQHDYDTLGSVMGQENAYRQAAEAIWSEVRQS